jgi:hypothetical protein
MSRIGPCLSTVAAAARRPDSCQITIGLLFVLLLLILSSTQQIFQSATPAIVSAPAVAVDLGLPDQADSSSLPAAAAAAAGGPAPAAADARLDWWKKARFGLFIHFGLYSILGGVWKGVATDGGPCPSEDMHKRYCGYSEWIRHNGEIHVGQYEGLAQAWNATKFDPDAWAGIAKQAGMGYVVLTTKHHEGFALWPSNAPGAWSVKHAASTRDIVGDLVRVCASGCV